MQGWRLGADAFSGLQPYAQAGTDALGQQQAAMGMQGPEAQQAYMDQLENSPYMQEMMQQGENAMLQNASATGGLRGGNMQAALAQFRPEMMQNYMDQNYSRLGGIAAQGGNVAQYMAGLGQNTTQNIFGAGQAAASGQASGGLQTAANVGSTLQNQGNQLGQIYAARGQGVSNAVGQMGQGLGYYLGQKNQPSAGGVTI